MWGADGPRRCGKRGKGGASAGGTGARTSTMMKRRPQSSSSRWPQLLESKTSDAPAASGVRTAVPRWSREPGGTSAAYLPPWAVRACDHESICPSATPHCTSNPSQLAVRDVATAPPSLHARTTTLLPWPRSTSAWWMSPPPRSERLCQSRGTEPGLGRAPAPAAAGGAAVAGARRARRSGAPRIIISPPLASGVVSSAMTIRHSTARAGGARQRAAASPSAAHGDILDMISSRQRRAAMCAGLRSEIPARQARDAPSCDHGDVWDVIKVRGRRWT